MTATKEDAKQTAREAEDSKPVEWLARLGLFGRGVLYTVVAVLAVQVALGYGGRADRNGALQAIKHKPLGTTLLLVLAVGFAGYALWRLLQAAVGHRDEEGRKRWGKRFVSLTRGVVYTVLTYSTVRFVLTDQAKDQTKPFTARVMDMPGGQLLVGAVGVGLVVGGLVLAYRGVKEKCLERVDLAGAPGVVRAVAGPVGIVGHVARGVVFALLGGFLVQAAVTFDPNKAKGVDAALKTLAHEPYGQVLLVLVGVGLLAFGLWSFLESRYRRI